MARKPNYNFERQERQRAKAAKKAARQEAKKERADKRKAENGGLAPAGGELSDSPGEPPPARPQEDGDPNR